MGVMNHKSCIYSFKNLNFLWYFHTKGHYRFDREILFYGPVVQKDEKNRKSLLGAYDA